MPFNIQNIAPYLGASGSAMVNLDENTTGADDFAGELLIYSAEVILSIEADEDLPPLPEVLTKGVNDKITGAARVSLIVASSVLPIVQFQVAGKARIALKYVNQVIRALLAGVAIPTTPDAIKQALQ